MNKNITRRCVDTDLMYLKKIWETVYPGDEPYRDLFFDISYNADDSFVAVCDDQAVGMFHGINGYTLHLGDKKYSGAYLYALGTIPGFRGRGIGEALVKAINDDSQDKNDLVCLNPASDSLRSWYETISDTTDAFYHRSINVSEGQADGEIEEISSEQYLSIREELLNDSVHIEPSNSSLNLQTRFSEMGGGGLFKITQDGHVGVCICDLDDEHLTMRELIFPDGNPKKSARLMMKRLAAKTCEARTPAFFHEGIGEIKADCVIFPQSRIIPNAAKHPYWGFLLD